EYKFCAQMTLPKDVKYQASKLNAGYFGVHMTMFLDSSTPGQLMHSNSTGVKVGLQASSDEWLSDITWTSTPPGGYSVKVIYQKIYHIKLSKHRSAICRNQRLLAQRGNISERVSSCEKFIDYEVTTRFNQFPTSQFGPILLSRACLHSSQQASSSSNNTSGNLNLSPLKSRIIHLVRTEPRLEKIYRNFLHIHVVADVDTDPVMQVWINLALMLCPSHMKVSKSGFVHTTWLTQWKSGIYSAPKCFYAH
ncbi:uncharacterized protein LOC142358186, partial [Convolutriloba macropyga]|uniref:uncharacterized protein LOC142358186 n=1 Tax=Convolutriloba macropyga TaxID=536237 RepID=UPI003F522FE5